MESKWKWLQRDTKWLLIALYPWLFALATLASAPFWNLQAGVRCAALWLVPMRQWWMIAVLEWLVLALFRFVLSDASITPVDLVDVFGPFICFAIAHAIVFFFVRPTAGIGSLRALVTRLFAAVVAAALSSFAFINTRHWLDGRDPQQFAFALLENRVGAWLGVMTLGLLIVTIAQRKFLAGRDFDLRTIGIALLPACILASLMQIDPVNAHVDAVVIAILPLLLVSHQLGFRAAIFAFCGVAACVLFQHAALPEIWQYGRVETFLVLVGFGATIIGGASDLMRHQHEAFAHTAVAETERSSRMSDVALRLTHQEEKERQRIAQDLHDQLGQDLTAIATYVQIASKRTDDLGTLQYLKTVSSLVEDAHWHLRAINDKLHPIALSRFGLVRALESGPVIELLTEQGFEYDFHAQGVDRHLPEKIEISFYRICQEAITNAIKHGRHRWLSVALVQESVDDLHARLTLRIHDDEGEIDFRNSTGYGLQGIRDRAHAIGASCEFNAENGTPRFLLIVEFERVQAQA